LSWRHSMALKQAVHPHRVSTLEVIVRVLAIVAAVLVAFVVLTMAFGIPGGAPSIEILPDPAGPLPF
jgi:hypothetical protein